MASSSQRSTIPSNITGMELHAPVSEQRAGVRCPLPSICPRITRRAHIYREAKTSRGLKGAKKTNLVDIPNLNDYHITVIDPGTSSMGARSAHRVAGKVQRIIRWETKGFRTDTSVLIQVQEYATSVLVEDETELLVVELQHSKFGVEFTQHTFINVALVYGIPVVVLGPMTRYHCYGIPIRSGNKKEQLGVIALDILTDNNDTEALDTILAVENKKVPNGSTVSKLKQQGDMLDTITLELCAEALLIQAMEELPTP